MKTFVKSIIISGLILSMGSVCAQTINWASLNEENKHIIHVNLGYEYGLIYGLGYGQQFKTRLFPIVATAQLSFPSGKYIKDDFKVKIGGQIRWIEYRNFQFSTRIEGVFRRYENDFVRLVNFGSNMAGIVGYYHPKWFVSGEIGFDKAILTHFKHSKAYREQYLGVVDGWYEPATGGNFYYGLQTGFSFKRHDINLKAGKIITQDFKTKPLIPFYAELGYNMKF